jgi:hypothetical protein
MRKSTKLRMEREKKRKGNYGMCEICGRIGKLNDGICKTCENKYPLM